MAFPRTGVPTSPGLWTHVLELSKRWYDEFKVAFIVGPKDRRALLERSLKEASPQSIGAFAAKDIPLTRTMTAALTG